MPQIINALMWVLIAYLVVKIVIASQQNKKNKGLIDVIQDVDNKAVFYSKIADLENQFKDKNPEFYNKTLVLKLWGAAQHKDSDLFHSVLNDLNVEALISNPNKGIAENNEDSFFYLFVSIPNILYGTNQKELLNPLFEKISTLEKQLSNVLVTQLGNQTKSYYETQGDQGKAFYQSILNGDYEGLAYSKNMISVYKSVCSSLLAKIAQDEHNEELFDEQMDNVRYFNSLGVGARFIKNLGLKLEEDEPKEEATREDMSETMVMEKLTDPEEEKK